MDWDREQKIYKTYVSYYAFNNETKIELQVSWESVS